MPIVVVAKQDRTLGEERRFDYGVYGRRRTVEPNLNFQELLLREQQLLTEHLRFPSFLRACSAHNFARPLHCYHGGNNLVHAASAGRISERIQKIPARRTRNAGHMRKPGFVSKKVGQQMIAGRDTRWKQKKIEILTWKRPFKLHLDKAGQAKYDLHMYVDRLKGN